jgi:hypothetical protein
MATDDAGDDVREVGLWIDVVELGRFDERGQDRPMLRKRSFSPTFSARH